MTKVSEVTVKSWKTFNEILSSTGGLEVLVRDPSDDTISRIQASILNGGTDSGEQWSDTVTYNIGDVVIFSNTFWESLQNGNLNNPPVEGSFWTEVEVSTANGFGRYAPGLYTVDPTVVVNGDSFYVLAEATTLPFNSVDFATELANGDWVQAGGNQFDSIKLDPNFTPVITTEGEIYWNGKFYTPEYDTGLGLTITVGTTVYLVFLNDTGSTIEPYRALHLIGGGVVSGETYPTFELADPRQPTKVQGTLVISGHQVLNGDLGLGIVYAEKLKTGDTSAIPAGSQLWITPDGTGTLTNIKPQWPNIAISVGGNYNQVAAPDGEIFVNFTSSINDRYDSAWDGSINETFDFVVTSDGATITGTLTNADVGRDFLPIKFSDVDPFEFDTTSSSIVLTAGTDTVPQSNYVYIPQSTKLLTLSTSGWPVAEHAKVALIVLQSATTTQTNGGALRNQNINDHIKTTGDNGHILHIAERIRRLNAEWDNGTEGSIDNTGGLGYVVVTGGQVWQLHKQDYPSFNTALSDTFKVVNDFTTPFVERSTLASITAYSDGSAWNNEWSKVVVWGICNKSGEPSFLMVNIPSDGYNSEANAVADALNYADYSIPDQYKGVGFLIAAFAIRISGGVVTYNSSVGYQDLRGFVPNNIAGGGGGGGGGFTTYLALTDTANSRAGKAGNVVVVNSGETADEYEPKNEIFNAARTFKKTDNVEVLTGDAVVNWPDKGGIPAFLDDIEVTRQRVNLTVVTNNITINCNSKNEFKSTNIVDVTANTTIDFTNQSNNEFGTFFVNITNLATLTFLPLPSEDFISSSDDWSPNTWTPPENGIFSIGWERVIDSGTAYYNLLFTPKASV